MSRIAQSSDGVVRAERQGAVVLLLLCKPPMNTIDDRLLVEFDRALGAVEDDLTVRALVVAGETDRAFSAGSDIKEFPVHLKRGSFVREKLAEENRVFTRFAELRVPTIAAIEGLALGGGLELAVCCDLVVASSTARLALPEIRIGGFPGSGGIVRVPRRIGFAKAAQMMLLGDPVDPILARDWGLVDNLAAPGTAIEVAIGLAQRMSQAPQTAVEACKAALISARQSFEKAALAKSLECSERIAGSRDFSEGVSAFIAKRRPIFGTHGDTHLRSNAD